MAGWKEKRMVMRRYDLTADMYDERYGEEQTAKYCAALENVKLAGGEVLDVGCGSGLFFSHISGSVSKVVGVDISRMLLLKAKAEAKKSVDIQVLQADADHLPFQDGSFEGVFAFTILQNMPNPSKTLRELRRVTKEDGRVVATGLKKVFPQEKFMHTLESCGFRIVSFVNDEKLKCYVAVLAKNPD